jgi:hypothetical protein
MPTQPDITWVLPLDRANLILTILADRKLSEVIDLFMDLQRQAQSQLQGQGQGQPGMMPGMPVPERARPNGGMES